MDNQPTYDQLNQASQMPPNLPRGMMRGQQRKRGYNSRLQRIKNWSSQMNQVGTLHIAWSMPRWLNDRAIWLYVGALFFITVLYFKYSLPWYYMLSGVASIWVFFFYGRNLSETLSYRRIHSVKEFEKKIFAIAFWARMIWTLLIYYIFMQIYGNAFGFENADAMFYHEAGEHLAFAIDNGNLHLFDELKKYAGEKIDFADMGYAIYLGIVYFIADNIMLDGILFARVLKCILSSLTVVFIYRLALRNFGSQVARISAIFCALWPNFWYYCGCQLKEVEMVFLSVLFAEQADQMLRSRQFSVWKILPILLSIGALFTIRTPLALVAILALLFSIVMSSSRVVTWGKRVIVGLVSLVLVVVTMGNRIQENVQQLVTQQQSFQQQGGMTWRAHRAQGNTYAQYATAAVFAPLIFSIPFPTIVRTFNGQDMQQLLNGGNYIKNILSILTILSMFVLLFSGSWRDHLIPLSFMLGYLVVLTMSNFAHSERFHQPAMPFELMFAAYGLSIVMSNKKYQRWFSYWFVFVFAVAVFWNWFKLAGRGLI